MTPHFTVVEIFENKLQQAIFCIDEDSAVEKFKTIVSEYGVEPYEEMINDKIFESEDGYTVQIKQMN